MPTHGGAHSRVVSRSVVYMGDLTDVKIKASNMELIGIRDRWFCLQTQCKFGRTKSVGVRACVCYCDACLRGDPVSCTEEGAGAFRSVAEASKSTKLAKRVCTKCLCKGHTMRHCPEEKPELSEQSE
eukprot:TRINITY_DN13647_c0_g1_i2.p1 TRINITY_DN13647_c0_g1~~TRINITY_DN13647_c0_g1_i2.p1  ORF type:complete len:127 (-),score=11.34 TRINITY_DN13647_c0_g1_i2:123-503(-)